ncbi:amino acid synthesis family protein [Pelagibius sp. Alg239-R121]|uniref:amino acid synthesis family protein n=1 Tax=Pelagibius sp. Alg239-R121 TaxID=2993448 RepID=UPI0024A69018|nr:amino acid synthesis family protein [Pelagibius sp. Alg239-R121]
MIDNEQASQPEIRKIVVQLEETYSEAGRQVEGAKHKVTVAAVIRNPFAGHYVDDLAPLYDLGRNISGMLADRGVQVLGVKPEEVTSYGKGAVVGVDGELEHAAALIHPRFGAPVRAAVGKGDDIIPSTKKMGGPGSVIVMPLTNKDSIWEFDDMDATEITVPDAPRSDEILVAVALGIGGRPLNRIKPD